MCHNSDTNLVAVVPLATATIKVDELVNLIFAYCDRVSPVKQEWVFRLRQAANIIEGRVRSEETRTQHKKNRQENPHCFIPPEHVRITMNTCACECGCDHPVPKTTDVCMQCECGLHPDQITAPKERVEHEPCHREECRICRPEASPGQLNVEIPSSG